MNDNDKTYPCPICTKGKYKECPLIQHLIDKHPDFPASKKIRNEYQFPITCPLCAQKITTPIAFITHYKIYHPKEFVTLKIELGFDFDSDDSTFKSGESLLIVSKLSPTPIFILQNDEKLFQSLHQLINKSPIMHSILKPSNLLVICCIKGIILIDLNTSGLGAYFQKCVVNQQQIIEFNTPNDSLFLKENYGIILTTNIVTDPFICQNYTLFVREYGPSISSNENKQIDITKTINKTDLKLNLINITLAYYYLISINYFPMNQTMNIEPQKKTQNTFKCPCCDISASNIIFIYRHLFRLHPFPTLIMNQYKMPEQPKGKFICETCHEQNLSSFDDLIIHVFENHRKELLMKTISYMESHKEIRKNNPELETFIRNEYKKINCE